MLLFNKCISGTASTLKSLKAYRASKTYMKLETPNRKPFLLRTQGTVRRRLHLKMRM